MKIHHNIIAAIILGLSLIITGLSLISAIKSYCHVPKSGRYIYRENEGERFVETLVFDTATGTSYTQLTSKDRPTIWSVKTIDDIEHAAQQRQKDYK